MGIMDDLEKSLTYVPTYQVVEQIRKEEKKIARDAINATKDMLKNERAQKEALVFALYEKNVSIEAIAKIMDVKVKEIERIINKLNN